MSLVQVEERTITRGRDTQSGDPSVVPTGVEDYGSAGRGPGDPGSVEGGSGGRPR